VYPDSDGAPLVRDIRFHTMAAPLVTANPRGFLTPPQLKKRIFRAPQCHKPNGSASLAQSRASIKPAADSENAMESRAIKTLPGTVVALAFLIAGTATGTSVQAQSAHPADSASMAKPPVDPSGARAYNPDNMPTKRPALPRNSERMLHNNPASDAIAK
jgi:hypothetical protein